MSTVIEMVQEAYSHWDDAAVLTRMGRALHDRNRLPLARQVLARAVEIDPASIDAWRYFAYAHLRDYDDKGGLEALRAGIEKTGSALMKSELAGFSPPEEGAALYAELESVDDPAVRAALIGRKVYSGEPLEALAELKALYLEHPGDKHVREQLIWSLLGIAWRKLAELDFEAESAPYVDERIADSPHTPGGYWMKAQFNLAAENWAGVLETTAACLERFPDEETQMQFRARAYKELGDLARAEMWLNRAIGAKPSFAGARVDLGKLCEQQERFGQAEELFREIAVANPAFPGKHLSLALFLARRERWDEAETLLCNAWPDLPAWMQNGLRQNPDAKALFERPRIAEVTTTGDGETVRKPS